MKQIIKEYIKKRPYIHMQNLLRELFNQNSKCFYCEIKTVMYEDLRHQNSRKNTDWPHHMATLEHKYSRYNPKRYMIDPLKNIVIACWGCNKKQEKKEVESLSHEIKVKLSRLPKRPKNFPKALFLFENGVFDDIKKLRNYG